MLRKALLAGFAMLLMVPAFTAEDAELRVRAKLVEMSRVPSASDIRPYREALVVYAYEVEKVRRGRCKAEAIRVAHWAVFGGRMQKDVRQREGRTYDLELQPLSTVPGIDTVKTSDTLRGRDDLPLFINAGQEVDDPAAERGNWDYASYSSKLRDLFILRNQVKLVAVGDSRTEAGIAAHLFYGDVNRRIPIAYNLGVSSSGLHVIELVVDNHLVHLPHLEWLVLGFSPRMVSTRWTDRRGRDLERCKGLRHDRKKENRFAESGPAVPLLASQIDWEDDPWGGYDQDDDTINNVDIKPQTGEWELDLEKWARFERILKRLDKRGVRVLVFTPPMPHGPDDDDTPDWAYDALVERLRATQALYPHLVFHDINNRGRNDFTRHHFRDNNHVNRAGAEKLTRMLEAIRRAPTWAGRLNITDTSPGLEWVPLRAGTRAYVDRDYCYAPVPEALRDLPVLRTRNDDKTNKDPDVAFTVDRPVDVLVVLPDHKDRRKWMQRFEQTDLRLAIPEHPYRVLRRSFDAGRISLGATVGGDRMYTVILRPRDRE